MPLDSIPTTIDVAALEAKRKAAGGQCHVDVLRVFGAGVVPGNIGESAALRAAGVMGSKCFLVDSDPTFLPVSAAEMERALAALAGLDVPLLVHAESDQVAATLPVVHGARYDDYLRSRPRGLEYLAVAQVIEAARRTGDHVHVCHLSSSDAVPMIRSAQADGVRVTTETCPHYLALSADDVTDGMTSMKCTPPIRERPDRELLWAGLRDGVIRAVVSDHSPCTTEMKQNGAGDFATAWGGISSLQVALPVVWTQARARGFSLSDIAAWMARGPANWRAWPRRAALKWGRTPTCGADPEEQFTVDPNRLFHRNPGARSTVARFSVWSARPGCEASPSTRAVPADSCFGAGTGYEGAGRQREHQRLDDGRHRGVRSPVRLGGDEIVALQPAFGADGVDCNFESYLAAVAVMDRVVTYEEPFDAVVLAGFGEHGRDGLQELVEQPVIEICEAAAHAAMMIGRTFSVVTTLRRSAAAVEDRLLLAGLGQRCASVRATNMSTSEVDRDPDAALVSILEEARRAVEVDHAEVIVSGALEWPASRRRSPSSSVCR